MTKTMEPPTCEPFSLIFDGKSGSQRMDDQLDKQLSKTVGIYALASFIEGCEFGFSAIDI